MDDYIYYLLTLTIDGLTTLYFSVQYIAAKKLFSTFTKSLENGVNNVDENKEGPQYVVVRGKVKSIGPPIKSLNKSFTSGVIQKLVVKEFVAEKSSFGMWVNQERIIDQKCNVVPFRLESDKLKITITSPLHAYYLDLEVVEDHFEPTVSSLLGLLFGIQQKGIQHTEYLLKEKSIITGFGEVAVEQNGFLQLIPPKNGMSYILTPMDPETLANKLASEKKFYGICCVIFGVVGIIVAGTLTYKLWKTYNRKKRIRELSAWARQAQVERRRNASATDPLNESFTCIICCVKPREVVLLPCGHISMCADCSCQCINAPCPVCRQEVVDTNLIYIS